MYSYFRMQGSRTFFTNPVSSQRKEMTRIVSSPHIYNFLSELNVKSTGSNWGVESPARESRLALQKLQKDLSTTIITSSLLYHEVYLFIEERRRRSILA
jgi:hypothetical protein